MLQSDLFQLSGLSYINPIPIGSRIHVGVPNDSRIHVGVPNNCQYEHTTQPTGI
jgi:hypothetical protein